MSWKKAPPKIPGVYTVKLERDVACVERNVELKGTYYGPKKGWSLIDDWAKWIRYYREI